MPNFLKTGGLFIVLILIWGMGWPILSMGLSDCPPIWYATIRLLLAAVIVFVFMGAFNKLILPQKKDIPLLCSIGVLQVGLFCLFITLGLAYVAPGRSAIIAYTSPFFITPITLIFCNEKLSLGKLLGLLLGAVGILLLFSPWELNWQDKPVLLGNGFLILSALVWSLAMLHTRYAQWHRPSHLLLPWQLLIGGLVNLLFACIVVPYPVIVLSNKFLFSVTYTAILGSAVGYWIMIVLTRQLPIVTLSLSLLAVPVVGLIASVIFIGEPLTLTMSIAFGCILGGLACLCCEKKI